MMANTLVVLCMLVLGMRITAGEPPATPRASMAAGSVSELSERDFDAAIGGFDVVMVNFYANWCRFSQVHSSAVVCGPARCRMLIDAARST